MTGTAVTDFAPHPNAPRISAPRPARMEPFVPAAHGSDRPLPAKATYEFGGRLPDLLRRPVFGALARVNDFVFRSAPPGDPVERTPGSWSFAAIGDYGSGSLAQAQVAQRILTDEPDLVVTLGDNIYWTGHERNWQRRWDPEHFFGGIRREIPVMPSLGNHDIAGGGADAYFRRFPELAGARYYSYQKQNVHFTVLDSNESLAPDSPQYRWFQREVASAPADAWKVVYFHHPMYSGYTARDGRLAESLGPILAKTGVDLVLTGHDHSYERTVPLNDHGTIHVLAGAGGHTVYPYLFRQPEWSAYRATDYGYLNVEVTDDRLVGRYRLRNGETLDTFVIERAARQAIEDAALGAGQATQ